MMRKTFLTTLCILTMFLLAGCAASQPKMRYVWPTPPDDPKIEYLGVFNNENDIKADSFATRFLGGEASPYVLRNPQMAAGDGLGRVYVTDLKLGAVFIFDFKAGKVSLLGGEGAVGMFGQPTGIAVDGDGFIYVADSAKRKIMVFTREGLPQGNLDFSAQLKTIGFIAIDKQRKRIIVPDPKASMVYVTDFKGTIITTITNIVGLGDSPEDGFNMPNAAAVAPDGTIVVADTFNARIVLFSPDGARLSSFGDRGDNPGQFNVIKGIAVDSNGHIYVTDARANRMTVMNAKGELLLAIGSTGDSLQKIGVFEIPFGISIDQNDTIYVVEKFFSRFQKYQYFSDDYLAKNPIKIESLAKPLEVNKKTPASSSSPPNPK